MEEQCVSGVEPSVATVWFFNKNKPYTIKKNVLLHEEMVFPRHSSSYTLNDDNHLSKISILPGRKPVVRHYTRLNGKELLNTDTKPWHWTDSLPRWNKKGGAPFAYSGEGRMIQFTDPGAIAFLGADRFPVYIIMSQVGYGYVPDVILFALDHEKGGIGLWLTKQADKEWDAIIIGRENQEFDLETLVEAE